jgi:HK97 family phage major capsid protein
MDRLNASLLTREALLAELRGKPQFFEAPINRASVNVDARTVELAFASELPYERWWGVEILDLQPKSVRMDRLKNNAALLLNHDRDQQPGVVDKARIDGDRVGRANVRFSRSALGEEILQDVADGIRTKVSVGYQVHDMVLEKKEGDLLTYRVTDWEPYEISIVSVPADDTVGVGRSAQRSARRATAMNEQTSSTAADPGGTDALVEASRNSESTARADERKTVARRNQDIIALGAQWPEYGGPDLALKAISDPNMTVEAFRAAMLKMLGEKHRGPTNTGALEADRLGPDHQRPGGGIPYGMAPREMLAATNLKMFKDIGRLMGKTDQEVAYRAGMWCMAAIHGNPNAIRWCQSAGVQLQQGTREQLGFADAQRNMTEGVFTSAGWLVPMEMEAAIIANREQYGAARRICNIIPMSSASTSIPRITGDATAYFVGEGSSGTAGDGTGDQVTLTLKDLMAWINIGKSTAQDTVVSLAEMVAREEARAFAVKEDSCLINGDGTSTYGGMLGLKTLLETAAYSAGVKAAVTPHNLFTEFDVGDITGVLGILPVYARAGARWLCSGVFDAVVFGRLKLNAGGNNVQTVQGTVVEGDYAGFPITIAHHMPAGASTDYNAKIVLILGNFNLGVAFGSGSGMMLTVDPYTLAHQNLTRIITTERLDINCHGVAKSTTAGQQGPIVGLQGTT